MIRWGVRRALISLSTFVDLGVCEGDIGERSAGPDGMERFARRSAMKRR